MNHLCHAGAVLHVLTVDRSRDTTSIVQIQSGDHGGADGDRHAHRLLDLQLLDALGDILGLRLLRPVHQAAAGDRRQQR